MWASLGPLDAAPNPAAPPAAPTARPALPQRPIVLAAAPLDASALFHDVAFGADAAASSLVAVLAAADALSRAPGAAGLPFQILFALFQAEQWGRLGSRRWLAEVDAFSCAANVTADASPTGRDYCAKPLRTDLSFAALSLRDFAYVLAVDQVGRPGLGELYLHEFDSRPAPTNTTYFTLNATLGAAGAPPSPLKLSFASLAVPSSQPPTPLLSWKEFTPPLRFDGAVLSGYDLYFESRYFHSEFDNASAVDAGSVTAVATLLARGLYALATNESSPAAAAAAVPLGVVANATFVAELLACITVNARCPLFAAALGVDAPTLAALVPDGPLSLYTSVYNQPYTLPGGGYVLQPKPLEAAVRNILAFATATVRLPGPGNCSATPDCLAATGSKAFECLFGACVVSNAFYHDALSPALAATDDAGVWDIALAKTTGEDVLWTEPYWSARIGATVFLKDAYAVEAGVLAAGVLTLAASAAGAWALVRWADAHFKVP